MRKGFDSGVVLGGIRNSYEVNILICYILKLKLDLIKKTKKNPNLKDAFLTYDEFSNILLKENLVNYFELNNSFSELVELDQINEIDIDGKKAYYITNKGLNNLDILMLELPKTIREKVAGKVSLLEAQKKRLEKNKATSIKVDDGYIVKLEILDIGSNLLTVELFAPDKTSASALEKSFLNNPKLLYQTVISSLTDDVSSLIGAINEKQENIF